MLPAPRLASSGFTLRTFAVVGVVALALLGCSVLAQPETPWLAGADVSALPTLEAHGAVYRDGGRKGDALAILHAHGVNCFRVRLFVAPNGEDVVTNDLPYTLALARRIKASGARLLLDIHYSDTWADPSKQFKPAAWAALDFPALTETVRAYTRDTLLAFVREGVAPDYVQLGNEITNGMLWPDGKVEFAERDTEPTAWSRLGVLLRAASEGLAEAFPAGPKPRTILHIESPNQIERASWFCREAAAAGVPYDIIGVSYYPDWHDKIGVLRRSLETLARTFRKPVLVAETAYPWKRDEHWDGRPHMDWPLTPKGQAGFLREVSTVVRSLPDGLGLGVCYWYPEAVRQPDFGVWVGGSCGLFDDRGRLLPAADELAARP